MGISPVPEALKHQETAVSGSSPERRSAMALFYVARALRAAAALTARVLELVLTLAFALLLITRAVLAQPAG